MAPVQALVYNRDTRVLYICPNTLRCHINKGMQGVENNVCVVAKKGSGSHKHKEIVKGNHKHCGNNTQTARGCPPPYWISSTLLTISLSTVLKFLHNITNGTSYSAEHPRCTLMVTPPQQHWCCQVLWKFHPCKICWATRREWDVCWKVSSVSNAKIQTFNAWLKLRYIVSDNDTVTS